MNQQQQEQPIATITCGASTITLLGTAHVSRASAEAVERLLQTGDYDAVAIELCPSRYNAIVDPDSLSRMNLFQVLRTGKTPMVAASLALGAFQQRMAEQFGIEPGAEMRAAIDTARQAKLPVLLIDRELGVTLKRVYRNIPWWRRMLLVSDLFGSVISRKEFDEQEIERLKEGDVLEGAFAQFAEQEKDLYLPLIDERDRYMAARLLEEVERTPHERILVVIGAGHLQGIETYLRAGIDTPAQTIAALEQVPAAPRWPKLIPWIIVAIILVGFAIGFSKSPQLGWGLIGDWILINGGLAALGALIAGAHPLTILGAFVAAPLTSLNPTIGAGFVTGAIETYLRKPEVGDFSRLRQDTARLKGWWKNRVSRIFLIFLLSSLGSVIGTYVGGFRIFGRLFGS